MPEKSYGIAALYVKNASVEVPHMARLPRLATRPQIAVDFSVKTTTAWTGHIECALTVVVHAKLGTLTMFVIEITQAAIFDINAIAGEDLERFARQTAPAILFPYARKHIAAWGIGAGFQPIVLDPIDFGAEVKPSTTQPQAVMANSAAPTPPAAVATPAVSSPPHAADVDLADKPTMTAQLATEIGLPASAQASPPRSRNLRRIGSTAIGVLLLGSLGFGLGWDSRRPPPPTEVVVDPGVAQRQKMAQRGRRIVELSQARLAEQAVGAYSLELGALANIEAAPTLETLQLERALFVQIVDGRPLVLYGVFPNETLARDASAELPTPLPAPLLGLIDRHPRPYPRRIDAYRPRHSASLTQSIDDAPHIAQRK